MNNVLEPIVPIDDKELEEKYIHRYEHKMLTRLFIEHKYKEAVKKQYEKNKKK